MIKDANSLYTMLVNRAIELGGVPRCKKVFLGVSGGIDSSLLTAILCDAYGPENVVGLHRMIRSSPNHLEDVKLLEESLGFKLVVVDANYMYDMFIEQVKAEFLSLGLPWHDEGGAEAKESGFENAYACLKSRFITPMSGFIAKAIDSGNGRIFGTGNGEEDGLLRYFDKYGDGAVDNNILDGLNKAEVRQLAIFRRNIPTRIITKTPSADLLGSGDEHNDETELTAWAKNLGYDIEVSYGSPDGSVEGNIAWAWQQDINFGFISGVLSNATIDEMNGFGYSEKQVELILFLRDIERRTRHKVLPIPGLPRKMLIQAGVIERWEKK